MTMRATPSTSAASSKRYFEISDYFEQDPNPMLKGQWFGKAAKMLGLVGEVDKQAFDRLVDNLHPVTSERLTQRMHAGRRVGTDLTLSAPKSVSLLWAATADDNVLRAVQNAATETMKECEVNVQTRVNERRGLMTLAKTGNLVGAAWLHTTSRPVDGYPDPNLHVHCFVINATHTGTRWTAADLSSVVADSGYFDAVFKSHLAANLRDLGYSIDRQRNGFEVSGVKRSTIEKFSRRTQEIEEEAARLGITDAKTKGELGARTRETKASSNVPPNQLHAKWLSLMDENERLLFRTLEAKGNLPRDERNVHQILEHVNLHCFERDAVVREREVAKQALLQGIDSFHPSEIQQAIETYPYIRQGMDEKTVLTTREVLREEQKLLDFVRSGKGHYQPMAAGHRFKQDWLSDEQKRAVTGVLESPDRLIILRGVAGSGKTSIMHETIDAIEAGGRRVTVLAPTAQAAHDVLHNVEGFNTETLAGFLANAESQLNAHRGLIWVDEGALVGTRDLAKLAAIAAKQEARIILSGDDKQHQPIAAGLPFRLLEEELGIKPFEISNIRRQTTDAYRSAVKDLSKGDVAAGVEKLDSLGFISEIEDDALRYQKLASDYADSIAEKQSVLVIAPSHAEREAVVSAIRNELKQRSVIDSNERIFNTLQSKQFTEAQRSDAVQYELGDVVEFITKGKGGFKSGDRLEVSSVENGRVYATLAESRVEIPLDSPKSFSVYRKVLRPFAIGDEIRITKNRKPTNPNEPRLNNGSVFKIVGFTKQGDLQLSNSQVLPAAWQHLDHGIALTSYSAQGKTYDKALVAQGNLSYSASSPEQLYVTASRAKKETMIYTNDKASFLAAVSKHRLNLNASDLVSADRPAVRPRRNRTLADQIEHIRHHVASFARKQATRMLEMYYSQAMSKELSR